MSADQMEVVENLLSCWFSFSMDTYSCSFEPDEDFVSKGIVFDDAPDVFLQSDPAFANAKPVALDEIYLVKALRNKTLDEIIPSEALEFYESCIQMVSKTFIPLLEGFIKNSAQIHKLQNNNQADKLLKFFTLSLHTQPNFGKHPILQKAASDYDAEVTNGLRGIGLQLQKSAQESRDRANQAILQQMKKCKQEFLDQAQADWAQLCYKTSRHNILDQR